MRPANGEVASRPYSTAGRREGQPPVSAEWLILPLWEERDVGCP